MKVVLVGNTQVGKTCLVSRLMTGTFRANSPATVGAAFQDHVMTTDKGIVSMQIWDTAGQEKYRSLTPMYYRNAHAAVLVFDVTNKESYESLEQWATDLEEKTTTDIKIFIAGNKCDLENRQVSEEEAREFAFKHGAICYVETSAKTGNGVLELFTKVAETCENVGKANAEQDRAVVSPGPATAQGGGGGGCQC